MAIRFRTNRVDVVLDSRQKCLALALMLSDGKSVRIWTDVPPIDGSSIGRQALSVLTAARDRYDKEIERIRNISIGTPRSDGRGD